MRVVRGSEQWREARRRAPARFREPVPNNQWGSETFLEHGIWGDRWWAFPGRDLIVEEPEGTFRTWSRKNFLKFFELVEG